MDETLKETFQVAIERLTAIGAIMDEMRQLELDVEAQESVLLESTQINSKLTMLSAVIEEDLTKLEALLPDGSPELGDAKIVEDATESVEIGTSAAILQDAAGNDVNVANQVNGTSNNEAAGQIRVKIEEASDGYNE